MTTHIVRYPFLRSTAEVPPDDGDGDWHEVATWKPGIVGIPDAGGGARNVAHGEGQMVLTEVARFRPGKYPTRVFYTRQWIDPDGKRFGKGDLRIMSSAGFKRLCAGYRYEYEVCEAEEMA